MTQERRTVDIGASPELARVAEEVQRTRIPCALMRDGEQVALIVPTGRRPSATGARSIAALAGSAGALRRAMPWKDVLATVREERARTHNAGRHE